jgi:hypothetical protein
MRGSTYLANLYKTWYPHSSRRLSIINLNTTIFLNMIFSRLPVILGLSFTSITAARSLAEPVIQHLAPRDSPYQGGWPLGLSTSATDKCPANSVACSTTNVNPTCCPAGNTCVWGPSQFQNYCCPTSESFHLNTHGPANMSPQAPTAMKQ